MLNKAKRVLFFDIETSLMLVGAFQLKTDYINPDFIVRDFHIISAAWKWLGDDKVYTALNDKGDNDKKIVQELAKVLATADVLVMHNGDKFDVKKLHTRMIRHGIMPTYSKLRTVDTLKEAKKHFSFSSNRLAYLAKFLGVQLKLHGNENFWVDELKGDHSSLEALVKYNAGDVVTLEEVYLRILPWIDHPSMSDGVSDACPNCSSTSTMKRGIRATRAGLNRQAHQCKNCYKYFMTKIEV